MSENTKRQELEIFKELLDKYRYDFVKLAYLIFQFGEKGTEMEDIHPYDWQIEEWRKLSFHLANPATRYELYRVIISSGNGAAKTAWGAMTMIMLMYTQQLRARVTANTDPQLKQIVWPEYDVWFRRARFHDLFFMKTGTSIQAKDENVAKTWRIDTFTWSEESPTAISGLHNKGKAVAYVFEEAPGIPSNIWSYATGAFTETGTIKVFMAFGNSDDPESQFEQNMTSPLWNSRRIDTRTLSHIDKKQIADWLLECGGNEDHDDFRVRVRGLPRKSAKDSIISLEVVEAAIARGQDESLDLSQFESLPCVLGCDPAWTGGDSTVIWMKQGPHYRILEIFKLDKNQGQDHFYTYNRLCYWESQKRADAVFVDQAEGTAVYTLAQNAGKVHWALIHFANRANDAADFTDSQYANIRAQMYYETNLSLIRGGIITSEKPEYIPLVKKQLCWTKGGRHKIHGKKIAEPKLDIKKRVGESPDIADAMVLTNAMPVTERLPENDGTRGELLTGATPYKMPDHPNPYDDLETTYERLYD